MRDALEETQELIEELRSTPEEERYQLSRRIEELSRRIRDASPRPLGVMGSSVGFASPNQWTVDLNWRPWSN